MKRIAQKISGGLLLRAIIILAAAIGSVLHAACTPPAAGIVGWWPGQGNANDIIGGNNGTLINGTGFTNGEVGTAFNFNGINNYVLLNPAATSLDVGQGGGFTFEGWIKPTTVTQQQLLAEYERVLGSGNGADVGLDLVIQSAATFYANIDDNTANPVGHEISTPANALVAGVWQHVALTYDKTSGLATLYINGAVATQANFGSFTPQTSYTNLLLGGRTYLGSAANPNTVYSGAMDEFSIYSRALSSNEIAAIYTAGSAGKCQNNGPLAPVITLQPTNVTVVVSNMAVFAVGAQGTALSYRWSFNQTNVLGGTNAILTLPNVQATQAGNYSVVVSNPGGSVTSAVAVLTVLVPPPPASCTPPAAGIVAWWPGQGNANDIIGGNNGTLMNGTGFTNGEVGTAFSFNGLNNYVLLNPTGTSLDVGQGGGFTFEGWIKPATVTQQQLLAEYERVLGSGSGADVGLDLVIQSAATFYANIGDNSVPSISHEISTPANALVAGVWQHVALTYDKTSGLATLYINGAVATQSNFGSFTPQTSFTNLLLGARTYLGSVANPNTVYSGAMDEFSIYNRALSSNEIAAIYLAGSAGKCQSSGPLAPVITQQPTNLTVVVSNTAVFAVGAQGTALSYRWSFNHTNVLGGTNAILTLANVQATQAGNYSVVVSNPGGSVTSAVAVLTVLVPTPPATCTPPAAGIVAWWPGQGNANDIVGGNNGTLMNGTGFTNGEVGTAFSFNGLNNYVLLNPTGTSLDVGQEAALRLKAGSSQRP